MNVPVLNQVLDKNIESFAKVDGGENYISTDTTKALQKAMEISKQFGDQYISLEPIVLGIISINDKTSQILKDAGANEKDLLAAIKDLRSGATVTSHSADDTYDALNRYAINLNERAKLGKLDPVIGRDDEIRMTTH